MVSVRLMAPFTPFLVETMYLNMAKVLPAAQREASVHFTEIPTVNEALLDPTVERAVERMQGIIELARQARDRRTLPIKLGLPEIQVYHEDAQLLADLRSVEQYIRSELNVGRVVLQQETTDVVVLQAAAENRRLGVRLGKRKDEYARLIEALPSAQIKQLQATGAIEIKGERFTTEDIVVTRRFGGDQKRFEAAWSNDSGCLVVVDTLITDEARRARLVREVINRVQKLRKSAGLVLTDTVEAFYAWPDGAVTAAVDTARQALAAAIAHSGAEIRNMTRCSLLPAALQSAQATRIFQTTSDVDAVYLRLWLCRPALAFKSLRNADEELAAAYLASRDYAVTSAALRAKPTIDVTVNGHTVTFRLGETVFLSAHDAASHK
jgi:hypothetical protein